MPTFARQVDAIPVVTTTANRTLLFPSPEQNQRVQNLETGAIERWTEGAWQADYDLYSSGGAINVLTYGAVGDGVTDDAVGLQAAFDAAIDGDTVILPATAGGYYQTSLPITAPANISIEMRQPMRYTGVSNVAILTVGTAQDINQRQTLRLGVVRTTRNWGSDSAVGIKLINCQHCRTEVFISTDSTIGVLATGDATAVSPAAARGFAYNDTSFGYIRDNKYAVVCESKGGSGANVGYINENIWRNGNFDCASGTLTTTSRYGVVIRSADAAYVDNNNNVFLKPCFQLAQPTGGAESVAFVVEDGGLNSVLRARFEDNALMARFSGASYRNYVDAAYADETEWLFEQIETASENWVSRPNRATSAYLSQPVFSLQDCARKARGVSGTKIMVEGVSWTESGAATRLASSGTSVTYDANEITIPGTRGMGVYVDTSVLKEFIVYRQGTNGGRLGVTAYDVSNAILTAATDVVGTISQVLTYGASYGGAFTTGSDTLRPVYFRVSDETTYVWVFVTGGTASATISGFSIYTTPYEGDVRAYAGFQTAFLYGTATWDPADIATGASTTTTVTVTGAALGDSVELAFDLSLAGATLTGYVSAANTVTAVLTNNTGGNVNLNSSTVRAYVRKQYAPA